MKTEYIKRYLLLCIGLFVMSLGVAFSIKANLGTSPISSVPYVISLISPMTVGTVTIIMHCGFIFLQVVILRKKYQLIQLMQLPVAFIFGFMTDFSLWVLKSVDYTSYITQWFLCAVGIFLVATGVSIEVTANVVTLAGEGLVLAICKVCPVKFGNMKVCFDVTLVVIAILIGFIAKGELLGVREGTIAAALFVGLIAKQLCKPLAEIMNRQTGDEQK